MKRIEREKGGVRSSRLLSTWLSWEPLTSGTCHGPLLAGPGSWLPLPGPQGSTQTGGRTGETLQEWPSVDLQGQGSEWAQSWMPSQHVGWNRGQRWGRLMNLDNKHSVGVRVAVVRDRPHEPTDNGCSIHTKTDQYGFQSQLLSNTNQDDVHLSPMPNIQA